MFILFFYLHIQFHLKTNDDLEIIEIDKRTKELFDEICDFRQPALFDLEDEHYNIVNSMNFKNLLDNYYQFEVKIRESLNKDKDNENKNKNKEFEFELFIPLQLHIAYKLFNKDTKSNFYSENNYDFLQETGIIKIIKQNDYYLRPPLVSNCFYDILMGSNGSVTPFRYDLNYRNYYTVLQGSVRIKLAPPKSSKYLYVENDYENFEFRSQINPWNVDNQYENDFNKVKYLEITLLPGKFFYIPAFWFYSFQFNDNAIIASFQYRTYMNNVAIIPQIVMHALQTNNVERKLIKKIDISEINKNELHTNKMKINEMETNEMEINEIETNEMETNEFDTNII
jgi:hypothetical protein